MKKKQLAFMLYPVVSLFFAFICMFHVPGMHSSAFASIVCDGGWQYDITFGGKHFHALDATNTVHNSGNRTVPLTATVKVIRTISASFDAELSGETGLLLAKVQAKFHISLAQSFTSEQGISLTVPVSPHTETHVTYGTYIYFYRVHSYFVQAQRCLIRNSRYSYFSAPKLDRAWNITFKTI